MKVIHTVKELQAALAVERGNNQSVGFVPTMGALHAGHIQLVKQSVAGNAVTVVSIFVNPTQFNNSSDLATYPRTLEADCQLLLPTGVDYVFAPSVAEVYPEPDTRQFAFDGLETVMEGKFRPGHFNGVAQVVSRLFEIVQPDRAYFGEKDFQQLAIIRHLVKQLGLRLELVAVPIVREQDGLALSSRNARLTHSQRAIVPLIARILAESKTYQKDFSVNQLKTRVVEAIHTQPGLEVEYFDIVDGTTLQSINKWSDTTYAVGCIAVYAGEVRLIDNITY
jgi:pantoate--beta-alanine ligase